jgi:branched-chain amino acid transport system substrate-binding protein
MARSRFGKLAGAVAALTLGVAGCSNVVIKNSAGGGDPGVSATQIDVGSIANATGPLSSGFGPVVNGVQAYFSMINAQGGVAGRKLKLAYQEDDQGSPTVDLSAAQQLVQQDHVFAVVGVGTPFFGGASYLAQQGTPTFGYVVSKDWENKPTLFGTYGSVLSFATAVPGEAYLAQQVGAKSIAVVAYGVPQSAGACQAAVTGMHAFGLNVTVSDLNLAYGADPTPYVLQMQEHHVDFLLSCLDVNGSVAFARAISQNDLAMHQLWLDGYDRSTLQQYSSIMNGVYFGLQHVPFEAASAFPGVYPGMESYIREMHRYQPSSTYDEVALDGWISAALFVSGLKAVGRDLTQKKLVAAVNTETAFTGGGLVSPVNWTTAHSTAESGKPPYCGAGVHVVNGQFVPRVVPGTHEMYVCFDPTSTTPVPPLPGTPGT